MLWKGKRENFAFEVEIMNSSTNGQKTALHLPQGKSVSCDCIRASSCIELADIRKLDSLLNQCESISCDNLLLYDEIYNYDLCAATKRKYVSTSALHKILPKNSIRRRAHKKVLGIRENDTKIIKLIDDKRQRDEATATAGELTKCDDVTQSCSDLMQHQPINFCDKTIQTSYGDLYGVACNNQPQPTQDKRKKGKRKQCSCRDYENVNFICETALTTPPKNCSPALLPKKSLLHDKSSTGRSSRFTKQKNLTVDDDECAANGNNSDGCHENRVININDKSVEIFPISLNSSYSPGATPRGGGIDAKSEKSETQSQKSKRSKFSPSFISRKLTSRLNSSEDDGAGGVKESLLGRSSKSVEKKLPEPVETVCIDADILLISCHFQFLFFVSPLLSTLSPPVRSILKIEDTAKKHIMWIFLQRFPPVDFKVSLEVKKKWPKKRPALKIFHSFFLAFEMTHLATIRNYLAFFVVGEVLCVSFLFMVKRSIPGKNWNNVLICFKRNRKIGNRFML